MRSKARTTFFLTLFATLGAIGFIGSAAADDHKGYGGDKGRLLAQAEIEDLMSCYAYTFDSIARAVDATNEVPFPWDFLDPINNSDPNFADGLQRFRGCTTEDWTIEVRLVNGDVLLPAGLIQGPLPWVNLVNNLSRPDGQINSQHLFGSFSNTVDGKNGTVTAYAIITSYYDGSGLQPEGTTTGTSTYTSDVVFERGEWLLQKTTLIVN